MSHLPVFLPETLYAFTISPIRATFPGHLTLYDSIILIIKIQVFWAVKPCSSVADTDVSEKHTASNFRVKDGVSDFLLRVSIRSKNYRKSSIFWDITPCSPLKVNRRFGGTCRLHLQGRRISKERNRRESSWQARPIHYGSVTPLVLQPCIGYTRLVLTANFSIQIIIIIVFCWQSSDNFCG
jgi:hypothetical protein